MNQQCQETAEGSTESSPGEVVMVMRVPPALGTRAGARVEALKDG